MAAKFFVVAILVAVANGSAIHGHDAGYSFSYGVSDPHTGDVKSQHETRVGDHVVGQYSLLDSDGTKRTVDYAADAHNGFNAIVRKDPVYAHAAPVVTHAVAAPHAHGYTAPHAHGYAAPLAHSYATSVAHGYASPLAHGYAAPLAHGYGGLGLHGAHGLYGAHWY